MTDEETPGLRSRSAPSVTNRHKTTDQRRVMLPSAAKKNAEKVVPAAIRRRGARGEKTALARIFRISSAKTFHYGTKINNHVP